MWISSTLLVLTAGMCSLAISAPAFSTERWLEQSYICEFVFFWLPSSLSTWPLLWLKQTRFRFWIWYNTPLSKALYKSIAFASSLLKTYLWRWFDTKKEVWIMFCLQVGWRILKLADSEMQLQMWMAPNPIRQELAAWTAAGSLQKQRQWWENIAERTADCNHHFIIH